MLGLGLWLNKNNQILKSFAKLVKDAGGVLYLDARKANGSSPLTGNQSPWVDLSKNGNNGTLTNIAGTTSSGWNVDNPVTPYDSNPTPPLSGQRIVDGVVDNGIDYGNWSLFDATTDGQSIEITSSTIDRAILQTNLKNSTQYTLKYEILSSDVDGTFLIQNNLTGSFLFPSTVIGVHTLAFTTQATIPKNELFLFVSGGTNGKKIKFKILKIYEGVTEPESGAWVSGNSKTGKLYNLTFDGVDDFIALANTPSLDIVTAPLALVDTFYIPTGSISGWLRAKDNITIQYGLYFNSSTNEIELWLENVKRASVVITLNTWNNVIFFWDGANITPVLNNVDQTPVAFVGTLTSQPNHYMGRKTSGEYLGHDRATSSIYIGSDLSKIKIAEAKISAEYLALNP